MDNDNILSAGRFSRLPVLIPGTVDLTEQGGEEAARYSLGCAQLSEKLKAALGLSEDVCSHIACTVLAELPEQLAVLSE